MTHVDDLVCEIKNLSWEDRRKIADEVNRPIWNVTLNGVDFPISDTLMNIFTEMYLPVVLENDREKYGL